MPGSGEVPREDQSPAVTPVQAESLDYASMDLPELHAEVDGINDDIVRLLLKRETIVDVIKMRKQAIGSPVRDFLRQNGQLQRVREMVGNKRYDGVFKQIFDVASRLQGEQPAQPARQTKRGGWPHSW